MLGRAQGERPSRQPVGLRLQLGELCGATLGDCLEHGAVDGDADTLHLGQNGDQRQLEIGEQPQQVPVGEPLGQKRVEAACAKRLAECLASVPVGRNRQSVLAQQVIDRIATATGIEQVGRQRSVEGRRDVLGTERTQGDLGIVGDQAGSDQGIGEAGRVGGGNPRSGVSDDGDEPLGDRKSGLGAVGEGNRQLGAGHGCAAHDRPGRDRRVECQRREQRVELVEPA